MKFSPLTLAGMLVVVAAIGGVYWFANRPALPGYTAPAAEPPGHGVTGTTASNTDPYDVIIHYTADGFNPADITLKQGQRVRFLNDSQDEMWPASGVHPTHSLYPEKESTDCLGSSFDACKGLKQGEFWDFTFYYPGTWRFHDHLHAYQTGSVTVTE